MKNKIKYKLPTELDISPTNGLNLDERAAIELFFGLTKEDAEYYFGSDRSQVYTESLCYIGEKAFDFYFPCLLAYTMSVRSKGNCGAINDLYHVLIQKINEGNNHLMKFRNQILECIDYCLEHFDDFYKFDYIYNFPSKHEEKLKRRMEKLKTEL